MNQALALLLPHRCLSCGEIVGGEGGLCTGCWPQMRFISDPVCETTGVPLEVDSIVRDLTALDPDRKPVYRKARSALIYDEASRRMILRFKNGDQTHLATALAEMMTRSGLALIQEADVICPVPLHWVKLMRRKYNQAALLARAVAETHEKFWAPDILRKARLTPPQSALKQKERRLKNLKGSFAVHPRFADVIKDRNVLLVDDVMTTGTTVEECARTLLKAGAARVDVLTLARVL